MSFMRMLRHLVRHARRHAPALFRRGATPASNRPSSSAESRSSGEIRFVIETALDIAELWAGLTPRERAVQVFSQLRVWDTELRNGVLIYVLVADRDVEIVADRGAAARISPAEWEAVCRLIESHFRAGRFTEGAAGGGGGGGRVVRAGISGRGPAIATSSRISRRCCSRMPTA